MGGYPAVYTPMGGYPLYIHHLGGYAGLCTPWEAMLVYVPPGYVHPTYHPGICPTHHPGYTSPVPHPAAVHLPGTP